MMSSTETGSHQCPACGIDVASVSKRLERESQKLILHREKLQVEEELLKHDKRNFKRRLKAAKLAAANSQAQVERQLTVVRQVNEAAQQQEQEWERRLKQSQIMYESLQEQHEGQLQSLEEQILSLQSHLKEAAKNNIQHRNHADVTNADLLKAEARIRELENNLLNTQGMLESCKERILELENEHPHCVEAAVDVNGILALNDAKGKSTNQLVDVAVVESGFEAISVEQDEKRDAGIEESQTYDRELEFLKVELETLRLEDEYKRAVMQDQTLQLDGLRKSNEMLRMQLKQAERTSTEVVNTGTPSDSSAHVEIDHNTHRFVMETEWDGTEYKGLYTGWVDEYGRPDAHGTLRCDDGAVYDGNWKHGQPHGSCVLATVEGDLYRGEWLEGKKHGKGVDVWSDGRVYHGQYVTGSRDGEGVMTWPYGASYRGSFASDKRNGRGEYFYADKRSYIGEYKDDRPHGRGKLLAADGSVTYDGQWQFGEYLGDGA